MARKFAAAVTPGSNQLLAAIGGTDAGTYLLNLTNKTVAPIKVRVAVTSGDVPADPDYINYDVLIPANGNLARWPVPLASGWRVYVYAAVAGISAQLLGLEKPF